MLIVAASIREIEGLEVGDDVTLVEKLSEHPVLNRYRVNQRVVSHNHSLVVHSKGCGSEQHCFTGQYSHPLGGHMLPHVLVVAGTEGSIDLVDTRFLRRVDDGVNAPVNGFSHFPDHGHRY